MDEINWANLFTHWSGPILAALGTIIVGAIIWGIQLNYVVLRHTGHLTILQEQIAKNEAEAGANYPQIAKTALLLDELEKRMHAVEAEAKSEREKSEGWRHRVVALEARASRT